MRTTIICFLLLFGTILGQSKLNTAKEYFEEGKYEISKSFYQDILIQDDTNPEANYYLSLIYSKLFSEWHNEDYLDLAVEYGEKAVELEPNNPQYYFDLGKLYLVEIQNASIFRMPGIAGAMEDSFRKAIELKPDFTEAKRFLAMFYLNAPGLFGGDMGKAKKLITEISPSDEIGAFEIRMAILAKEEKLDSVKVALETFISERKPDRKLNKKMANIYNTLAYFYLKSHQLDKTYSAIEEANKLAPDDTTKLYLQLTQEKALNKYNEKILGNLNLARLQGIFKNGNKIIEVEVDEDNLVIKITAENSRDVYESECYRAGDSLFVDSQTGEFIYFPNLKNGNTDELTYISQNSLIGYNRLK